MTLETAVGQKLITEDSKNGLPTRLIDSTGANTAVVDAAGKLSVNANVYPTPYRAIRQASAAQTAGGQTAAQTFQSYSALIAFLRVIAVAGTTPTLNVFIDISDDGGTTWYQAGQLGPANIAAVPAAPYVGYHASMGPGCSAAGSIPINPGDTYRYRWVIGGTTPSFTFQITDIQK